MEKDHVKFFDKNAALLIYLEVLRGKLPSMPFSTAATAADIP